MKILVRMIKEHQLRYAGFLIFYVAAALIIAVCEVLINRATGEISQAAITFEVSVLTQFLLYMAVILGIKAFMAALSAGLTGRFSGKAGYKMREHFARHFTYIRYPDLEKKNSGAMLSLFTNDLPKAIYFVTQGSLDMLSDFVSIIVIFVYMFTVHPWYTLIFLLMFPLLVWLQIKISVPIQKKAMVMSTERANFNAVVNDSLQNIPTIVAYSLEERIEKRYLTAYDKFFKASQDYIKSLLALVLSGMLATMLPLMFIFAAAGMSVARGDMRLSVFIAYTAVAGIANSWLMMLSQRLQNWQASAASAVNIQKNMEDPLEDITTGDTVFKESPSAIRFEEVSFAYNDNTPAIKNVSFEIPKGSRTAIVGYSGSGKSTVLKLLLGLYEPHSGDIYVSGRHTKEMARKAIRAQLAYVPQDSFMFPLSIRENLTRADGMPPSDAVLEKACANAGILDFINSLPGRFDTVLTEAGDNVSGGQRQRLSLAGAFAQDAPILVLDEATSALDALSEADVIKSLHTTLRDKTVVMVTHRLQAIDACDTVIMMENGRITGMGRHDVLIKENAAYAALYESLRHEERSASHV